MFNLASLLVAAAAAGAASAAPSAPSAQLVRRGGGEDAHAILLELFTNIENIRVKLRKFYFICISKQR
jgi:hypothetical protein